MNKRLPRWPWAAIGAALAWQAAAALRAPLGLLNDEALHLLLAESLLAGSFLLPDGFALPVTDPWPGFPALLALPAWVLGRNWAAMRSFALIGAAGILWLTHRLLRRRLPEAWAAAGALLCGLSPAWVLYAGMLAPEIPFVGVSLLVFSGLETGASLAALTAGCGLAALIRPHGVALTAAVALAVGWRDGPRRGAALAAGALAPLTAWLCRNWVLGGGVTDYLARAGAVEPSPLSHAADLLSVLVGGGMLGLGGYAPALAGGAAALLLSAYGAAKLLRRGRDPLVFSLACFAGLTLCLHLSWEPVQERYVIALLPALWLLTLAGIGSGRAAAEQAALGALLAGLLFWRGLAQWRQLPGGTGLWPETMTWIREETPPSALFQSASQAPVMLLSGRPAVGLFEGVFLRDHWLAKCLQNRVEYLLMEESMGRWASLPPAWRSRVELWRSWAAASRFVTPAFRSPREGTVVLRLRHPDPARFLRAWQAYREAAAARARGDIPMERDRLRAAISLEPELSAARDDLALLRKPLP